MELPRPVSLFSSNRDIAVVQADYLALANDLEQARALATTLEAQLCGKSNELAQFKVVWERTQTDLIKFAQDLDTMRKERHALANEVQCGYAVEHKYEKLKATHEALVAKTEELEAELMRERAVHVQTRLEVEELRLKANTRPTGLGLAREPDLRRSLQALREQLDRVLGGPARGADLPAPVAVESAHIDIEFGA